MRIFSKKSFKFQLGENVYQCLSMQFSDAPDWLRETKLFQLALSDKSIEIIESKEQSKQLANEGMTEEEKEIRELAKNLGIQNSSRKSIQTLKKEIGELQAASE